MAVPGQLPYNVPSNDNGKTFVVRDSTTGPVAVSVVFSDAAQGANSQVTETSVPSIPDAQNRGITWLVYFRVRKANKRPGDTSTFPYTVEMVVKDTSKTYYFYDGSTIKTIAKGTARASFPLTTEDPAVGMG